MITFFQFTCYLIFRRFVRKNDSPVLTSFVYMYSVLVIFGLVVFSFLRSGIDKIWGISFSLENYNKYLLVIGCILFFMTLTHLLFFRKKDFSYYHKKYDGHWLNKYYKEWMLIFMPVLILLTGFAFIVVVFGGEIFNYHLDGFIN